MGHPSTRFVRIVFDDEEAARHRHRTFAIANECRLIVDVVQRVGHENATQVGEWPRVVREVTAMRCDADTLMLGRDPSKPGFPIWPWYPAPQNSRQALIFQGTDARNPATEVTPCG